MNSMFIDVEKITTNRKKANDGSTVANPLTKETVKDSKPKIQKETIRIDEIRSFRKWSKDMEQEALFENQLTKIYFKGNGSKDTQPEMLIHESHESFSKRINAIQLNNG